MTLINVKILLRFSLAKYMIFQKMQHSFEVELQNSSVILIIKKQCLIKSNLALYIREWYKF